MTSEQFDLMGILKNIMHHKNGKVMENSKLAMLMMKINAIVLPILSEFDIPSYETGHDGMMRYLTKLLESVVENYNEAFPGKPMRRMRNAVEKLINTIAHPGDVPTFDEMEQEYANLESGQLLCLDSGEVVQHSDKWMKFSTSYFGMLVASGDGLLSRGLSHFAGVRSESEITDIVVKFSYGDVLQCYDVDTGAFIEEDQCHFAMYQDHCIGITCNNRFALFQVLQVHLMEMGKSMEIIKKYKRYSEKYDTTKYDDRIQRLKRLESMAGAPKMVLVE